VVLLVCASPLNAQTTGVGSAPRAESNQRPEETAATALLKSGKPREALGELDRAAAAFRRAGDYLGLARVALKRSTARGALGELDHAARDAEEALSHSTGNPALRLEALSQIARVATDRSDFARGDAALREAIPIAERLGDLRTQATTLRTLAILEDRRGLQQEALSHHAQAVIAADRSGDVPLRVRTRGARSVTLLGLSQYDAALAVAQESYDIAERSGVPALRAAALFDLAQTNAHIWNLDRAAELWSATIDANRQIGNHRAAAAALKQSVETSFALGEFDRAAKDGETAVELLRANGQSQYVAETTARVALSEVRRGRTAEARAWAGRARAALPTAPESRHLFVYNDLGIVESELGDLARAHADFTRVLEVAQQVGNVEYEWRAHWGFGRTAIRKTPADAVAPLERAIASIERLRATIPEAGLRAGFMINRVGPYETLVEAHMAAARGADDVPVRQAFEVAERARSRALADLLAESRARISEPRLAALRDQETAFGGRFTAVQKRVAQTSDPAARAEALRELQDLEHEYERLVVRIRRDNPAYAALAHPRALPASELSAMLAPDEALIEFLLTDTQGFAWVVRRNTVRGYRVPGRKALDTQVRLLGAVLAARDDGATRQLGAQLYTSLLGPAESALTGARRLILVPDGPLQRLPFALLRSRDRWLVETHILTLAPSGTILHFLRQPRPVHAREPLLALAVPDVEPGRAAIFDGRARSLGSLRHAADEVRSARRLLNADADSVRTGSAATEHVLKSPEAARYRILHFAAHAIADEVVPRRSAVVLAPGGQDDGLLQVSEIANLSLDADLVVLAACRSHVGRLVRGEGLLSLSRAFMHGGARAVVATTWTVTDRDTAWLMRRFYTGLRDGLAPDEALQRAQRQALASWGAQSAPGMWAAFVVLGEARSPILDSSTTGVRSTLAALTGSVVGMAVIAAIAAASWVRSRRSRPGSPHAEAGRR
jgi:CHAT domain-containing protein